MSENLLNKREKIDQMINAGVHFGHKKSKWCPKMSPYIWGHRNGVYYIDVAKTLFIIEKAKEYLMNVTKNGGRILWVGTKKSAAAAVGAVAAELGQPYVNHRWIGGTLTNFEQVKKGVTKLMDLREIVAKPLASLKKKEIGRISKEVQRLEKNFGGIVGFRYPPAVVVVVDVKASATAVKEAFSCNIPVIGLVDTNSDPSGLAIAIPTNDDSTKSVSLVLSLLAEGAKAGIDLHKEAKANEAQKTVLDKALDASKDSKGSSQNKGSAPAANRNHGRGAGHGQHSRPQGRHNDSGNRSGGHAAASKQSNPESSKAVAETKVQAFVEVKDSSENDSSKS